MEAGHAKPQLLLIDDEPYVLEALRRLLQGEPYDAHACNNPLEALEWLANQTQCAIILSDNLMPGMKGLELLTRAKDVTPHTRRLLLTGHTELNEAVDAFNRGVIHRFLNKPWDANELRTVLREELQSYQRASEDSQQRAAAEEISQRARAQLRNALQELKQALTQVALHEDSTRTRRLRLTPRLRRLSIHIVEGDVKVRQLLVSALQNAGILAVSASGNVEQALRYLREVPAVDLILCEWSLPEFDGLALFQALRAGQTNSARALFILMTAREHRQAVEQALAAGVDYYLIKPFHLEMLFEQVERLLNRARKEPRETKLAALRNLRFVISNIDHETCYRIRQMLVLNGLQNVTLANSGAMFLRVVQERPVDVAIVDCNLVDLDWPDLRARLKEMSGDNWPPAVVVTSISPIAQEFERIHAAGFNAFLPGPIRQRDLIDSIFKALEGEERFDIFDVVQL